MATPIDAVNPPVRKKSRGCLMILMALFLMTGCTIVAVVGFGMALVSRYSQDLPDVERLRSYQPSETTRIYAADGSLIATLFKENRTWVPIEKVSPWFRKAILATEDARFYEHNGVDFIGVARAAVKDYTSGGAAQGASTITMQLARNIFLHPKVTLQRKIQEMLISMQLERKFTKDQILELYMNQVYFGSGAYGIEAAADTYFAKKAKDLTLAEAAMIAGITPAPSSYSPQVSLHLAKVRQILVLKRMVDVGAVSQKEALEAMREPLVIAEPRRTVSVLKLPYFTTYVLHELFQKYDEDLLYRGGLRIYTTVEPKIQEAAEEAVTWGVKNLGPSYNVHQSALVSIEPRTGYIRAMAGGTGWNEKNQFNRAWQTQRQPGSTFKIFVYLTALESGYTPDSVVPDSPFSVRIGPKDVWTPLNSGGGYMGAIPLRTALQHSRNVVAARLVAALTPERIIDTAYKMGVRSHVEPNLSIALGAVALSPLEMATALATLANGGVHQDATAIKMIKDPEGNLLEDNSYPYQQEVLSPLSALAMSQMLQNAVENGTGTGARIDGRWVAGKTGTTDSKKDAWFCGFIPQLATAVWCGNDDNSATYSFGGDISAPIWKRFTLNALKALPKDQARPRYFMADAKDNVRVGMCADSKRRANTVCPHVEYKIVKSKDLPAGFCTQHAYTARSQYEITKDKDSKSDKDKDAHKDDAEAKKKADTPDKPAATPVEPDEPPANPDTTPTEPAPGAPGAPEEQPAPIQVEPVKPAPEKMPEPPVPVPTREAPPRPAPTGDDQI
ncbi:MAG: PBP1A family penicillin-binding protein [Proteobacteria bacterium]|nr:PBP1A family penicillin-binding protein [Pseudomonadota bacterium]